MPVESTITGAAIDRCELPREQLSIYIDETWPGSQDHRYRNIGVIGGVVVPWSGTNARLPTIATHLRTKFAKSAIRTMLAAKGVLPFVFPIRLDASAGGNYFLLVQHAVMLLLGWIIPRSDRPRTANISSSRHSGETSISLKMPFASIAPMRRIGRRSRTIILTN